MIQNALFLKDDDWPFWSLVSLESGSGEGLTLKTVSDRKLPTKDCSESLKFSKILTILKKISRILYRTIIYRDVAM